MLEPGPPHEISQLTLAFEEVLAREWMAVRRLLGEEVDSDALIVCIPGPIEDRSRQHLRLVPHGGCVDHGVGIRGSAYLGDESLPGRVVRVEPPTQAGSLQIPGRAFEVRGFHGDRGECRPSLGESPLRREIRSIRNHRPQPTSVTFASSVPSASILGVGLAVHDPHRSGDAVAVEAE